MKDLYESLPSGSHADMCGHMDMLKLLYLCEWHLEILQHGMRLLTFRRWDLNPPAQCHHAEIFRAGF